MLKNYFKVAIRNLRKYGSYSIINIAGLAVGLSCTILILLWVSDELSWDRFHSNIDRLYHVYINRPENNGLFTQTVVPLGLWQEIKNTPGVKHASPSANSGVQLVLAYGDKRLEMKFDYASEDFLNMFDFPLASGTHENQLNDPSSIVLTESAVKALFGDDDAIGKVVRVDNQADLTVSGVLKDPPHNSTFHFDGLIPMQVLMAFDPGVKEDLSNFDDSSWYINIELEEGTDPAELENRIRGMITEHSEKSDYELALFPFKDTRLYSEFRDGKSVGGAIEYVRIFSIIAFLILGLACINFMNLSTAKSESRGKEVGIRKTVGSNKKQLIFQFLIETILMTLFALIIAIGIVELLLPFYNTLVNKNLFIDYSSPLVWLTAIGFILITGLVAGSYPAFFLSSLKPIKVLKGKLSFGKQGNLPRKILVTAQFVFSIGLVISTIVIYHQLDFIKNRNIGYNKDNLLMVSATGEVRQHYELIKKDLIEKNLAESVTSSSSPLTDIHGWSKPEWRGQTEDKKAFFAIVGVENEYAKTIDAKILQGREFEKRFNDSSSVMLNKAALDFMELEDPIGEVIRYGDRNYTVVGILDDVIMGSPYHPANPTLFLAKPWWLNDVIIRLPEEDNISETMAGIGDVFKQYNPEFPFSYSFVDQEFNKKFMAEELIGKLARVFAFLALFISFLGVFGLSSFTAAQRTKEVGIRKVMGATMVNILSLLSKDFIRLIVIAFLLSAPVTWWLLNQWLMDYSYRVTIEWWMVMTGGITAILLTWLIVGIQAYRVAELNPTESLKEE